MIVSSGHLWDMNSSNRLHTRLACRSAFAPADHVRLIFRLSEVLPVRISEG